MPDTKSRDQERRVLQPKVQKKKGKIRTYLTVLSLFALVAIVACTGAAYWKIHHAIELISTNDDEKLTTIPTKPPDKDTTNDSEQPFAVLILGLDWREEGGPMNTDVMMLSIINPKTKKVTLLSIPRDTRVKIPGYKDYHKINAVYAYGEAERRQAERAGEPVTENGISLTKKTLEQVFGIPIQHYVKLDFSGFMTIIDELGGVEVTVDRKLVYDDPTDGTHIKLDPGVQVLNGEQALGFVRHRHDNRGTKYFSSDYERNERQQEVIKSLIDKMTGLEGITKLFKVIEIGSEHIRTDLSVNQIEGLAVKFKGVSSADIRSLENGAYWSSRSSYSFFPKDKLEEIRSALQAEMGVSPSSSEERNDSVVEN